jgi:hypothetical protein
LEPRQLLTFFAPGDPLSFVAIGSGPGEVAEVRVTDTAGSRQFSFNPYPAAFKGGVRVGVGDVNNDGTPDIVTAAGPGGGPHIRVIDGQSRELIFDFFAFDQDFRGGVTVALGDFNGDGHADILVGADAGGGPHLRIFSGKDLDLLANFFAFDAGFRGGVRVAAGDLNGDGRPDIVVGAGTGGGPHVRIFEMGQGGVSQLDHALANFFAYNSEFRGGVFLAVGDLNGDGRDDLVTTPGSGGGARRGSRRSWASGCGRRWSGCCERAGRCWSRCGKRTGQARTGPRAIS